MLEILLSQVVSGLILGGLYVLIAIGLSIIFGLLGIVNFAHGTFFTLGAYLALDTLPILRLASAAILGTDLRRGDRAWSRNGC